MLALFLLWIVVYLSGRVLCKIGGEKEASQCWIHLTGFFFLFLSQGIVFFTGQLMGKSFSACIRSLEIIYLLTVVFALIICGNNLIREIKQIIRGGRAGFRQIRENNPYLRHVCLLLWLLLGLFIVIAGQWQANRGDAMVETAGITLLTDTLNEYHPFTHQPLELGVIFTRRLNTLPFWYAALSHWTGFPVAGAVTLVGSMVSLIFALLAVAELGDLLFEGNRHHIYWLIIIMELLYLSGDYHQKSEGYGQLYYGYSGETLLTAIVIPVMVTILYRRFGTALRHGFDKNRYGISIWSTLVKLCLVTGAVLFITNLKWGIIMLLLSMGIFLLMIFLIATMKRISGKREDRV